MDSSFDSDSDDESVTPETVVSETEAKFNYEEAGNLIAEEKDRISLDKHSDKIDPRCAEVLSKVEDELSLPYHLSDFQKLSINIMLQKKDQILLSPTGTGKVGILLLNTLKKCFINYILRVQFYT